MSDTMDAPAVSEPLAQGKPRRLSRRKVLIGLGAVGVAAATGGLVWWIRSRPLVYRGHTDNISTLMWSPRGQRIASGSYDETIQIWNSTDGGDVLTYRGHSSPISSLAWSPDGTRLASTAGDVEVLVW